jgi:hypothetical protein
MATNIKLSQRDNGSRKPSVADTYHVDADPDPAFLFDADPDPTFYLDVDSDPTFHFVADPDPDPAPDECETNLQQLAYWLALL